MGVREQRGLEQYIAKRRFDVSPEPRGARAPTGGNAFVVQKHAARRLHYDLRLELDGVMLSWAVTRGPSLVPGEKRLAMHVEDHPIEYNAFEGTIPAGQYGAGTVMIWDRGAWKPEGDPHKGYKKGHLEFTLDGEKLQGRWHLVRMRARSGERGDPWLLIKVDDEAARPEGAEDILDAMPLSVATGRDMDEIAAGTRAVKKSAKKTEKGTPAKQTAKNQPVKKKTGKKRPAQKKVVKKMAAKKSAGKTQAAKKATRKKTAKKSAAKKTAKKTAAKKTTATSSAKRTSRALNAPAAPKKVSATRIPEFVAPCLAKLSATAADSDAWVHEIKFDGYRMQARIVDGAIALRTRTGLDWTRRFQPIADALGALADRQAMLDGEIVVETTDGVSSFSALQEELKSGRGDRFVYYVFDLLHLDGDDLRPLPLTVRKAALSELLAALPEEGAIRFSAHFETEGSVLLEHACRLNLEGIISKRRDAPYRSGRGGDWLKTKCTQRQEFVIAGIVPATHDAKAVGSLVLGYYDDGELKYAGRTGTGFTHANARALWRQLSPLKAGKIPFASMPAEERRARRATWIAPKTVAEVEVREWTDGGRVRHAAFKGLREDKDARQVVREEAPMPASSSPAKSNGTKRPRPARKTAGADMGLSNPDRVYWDDVGLTKQGLAEYYTRVWDWIAPHITGRVLSLLRCPEGASKQCFFQKHAAAGLDSSKLKLVPEDGDEVIAVDSLEGLVALVQAGVLEIHVRGSQIAHLASADRIVFDLDPGPNVDWATVKQAAREVRARLEDMKLKSFIKTTGGKGLHVVVPIAATPWDEVKAFANALANAMAAEKPDSYVAKSTKQARTGRIFVDYLRNSREATAIAPYSTRARPGATVSTPITWDELSALDAPNRYNVGNLMQRLGRLKRDPWAGIADVRQRLPARAKR